jgi:hypothetical protein
LGLLYVHIMSNYNFIKLHLKRSGLLCYCEEMLMTTRRMQPQAGGGDRPSSGRRAATRCPSSGRRAATRCPSSGHRRPSPFHERRGERREANARLAKLNLLFHVELIRIISNTWKCSPSTISRFIVNAAILVLI